MSGKKEKEPSKDDHEPDIKRPIDPKRVLQILECRRRVLAFVESMMEPEISIEELRSGEELLCQQDYECIVQERYLQKICGYPLCSNEITKEWKQRYHVSLRDKRIYDVEVRKLYCSVKCMDTSIKYRDDNLPEQPIWMRLDDMKVGPNIDIQTAEFK